MWYHHTYVGWWTILIRMNIERMNEKKMLFGSLESRNKLVQFSAALVSDKKLISIIVFLIQWKYVDGKKKKWKSVTVAVISIRLLVWFFFYSGCWMAMALCTCIVWYSSKFWLWLPFGLTRIIVSCDLFFSRLVIAGNHINWFLLVFMVDVF